MPTEAARAVEACLLELRGVDAELDGIQRLLDRAAFGRDALAIAQLVGQRATLLEKRYAAAVRHRAAVVAAAPKPAKGCPIDLRRYYPGAHAAKAPGTRHADLALVVKSLDQEQRLVEGWASTPAVDRIGDSMDPEGARYHLPLPLLLDHDHKNQVGHVIDAKTSPDGIRFTARFPKITEPGAVKDAVDKAWHLVKHGLRSAVSIGFRPRVGGMEPIKSGYRFSEYDWVELSLVSVPANAAAVITGVRNAP